MIIRAVFFIGLVYLLAPHEPDLGLGRPGAGTWLLSPSSVLSAAGLSQIGQACGACAGGAVSLPQMPDLHPSMNFELGGRSLSDVKAEIRAAIAARRAASRS